LAGTEHELEIKLYLTNLATFQARLGEAGAQLICPRLHEVNLRYDTPDNALTKNYQVLRLRQDNAARLTYKGPGEIVGGVHDRREIEFTVDDFQAADHLLQALGYQVSLMYEKYRTTYTIMDVQVTLDEMPYGDFVEIEGPDAKSIQVVTQQLGLSWEARVLASYTSLFDHLKTTRNLEFRDLSFENFVGLQISPQDLGVKPADDL
jgi:adenylate cyclase, class 2